METLIGILFSQKETLSKYINWYYILILFEMTWLFLSEKKEQENKATLNLILLLWLVWLSGLSAGQRINELLVQCPVRAHAWVVGKVPSRGRARGNHTWMFLSHFLPQRPYLKINKIKSLKNKFYFIKTIVYFHLKFLFLWYKSSWRLLNNA